MAATDRSTGALPDSLRHPGLRSDLDPSELPPGFAYLGRWTSRWAWDATPHAPGYGQPHRLIWWGTDDVLGDLRDSERPTAETTLWRSTPDNPAPFCLPVTLAAPGPGGVLTPLPYGDARDFELTLDVYLARYHETVGGRAGGRLDTVVTWQPLAEAFRAATGLVIVGQNRTQSRLFRPLGFRPPVHAIRFRTGLTV